MNPYEEFDKYATKHLGISSMHMHQYKSMQKGDMLNSMTPYILEERQLNVTPLDVFSRLLMDRIIIIGAPIYPNVANIIQAQLLFLESTEPGKDIQMYFNTTGGMVYYGLGIYDTMQYISSDVATICTGIAASLGAVLLCAGEKGKRSALKHSRIMLHQPIGAIGGQASDIEIVNQEVQKIKNDLYDIISNHTGKSVEEIEKDADRDFWMSATDAKEYGLIDEVLLRQKNNS